MRNSRYILAALGLLLASGAALAHYCPADMKAIDAKLATKPALTRSDMSKVQKLRADGEAQHKAGDHDASVKSLGEAKKILGL